MTTYPDFAHCCSDAAWPKPSGVLGIRELRKDGAGDRDRTGDIQLGKLAFYR
jgi:hypothetical protein